MEASDAGLQLVGLPHEVIEAILLAMGLRDMVALGLTCRQLHALATDNTSASSLLWQKRYAMAWGRPPAARAGLARATSEKCDWRQLYAIKAALEDRWRTGPYALTTELAPLNGISVIQLWRGTERRAEAAEAAVVRVGDAGTKKHGRHRNNKDKPETDARTQQDEASPAWGWELVCADFFGRIHLWDGVGQGPTKSLQAHPARISWLEVRGDMCVSIADDGSVKVTDLDAWQIIHTLAGHEGHCVWCVDLNLEHDIVITGNIRGLLIGHRLSTGQEIFRHKFNSGVVVCCFVPSTGRCLVTLLGPGIYELDPVPDEVTEWGTHAEGTAVLCLRLYDDHIISGGGDMTVRVWDARTGTCLRVLEVQGTVYDVRLSEGKLVAGLTNHTTGLAELQVWHYATGELCRDIPLNQLKSRIYSLTALPDRVYVTASRVVAVDFSEQDQTSATKASKCLLQ